MKCLSMIAVYNDVRIFRITKAFMKTSIEINKTIGLLISLTFGFLIEANN